MTESAACATIVRFSLSRFTGKEHDQESGNDYFGARYYASAVGRWLSPDWSAKVEPVPYAKMDDPQTLNLYAYMRNSPLGGVDADGHIGLGAGGFEDCSERNDCNGGGQTAAQVQVNMISNILAAGGTVKINLRFGSGGGGDGGDGGGGGSGSYYVKQLSATYDYDLGGGRWGQYGAQYGLFNSSEMVRDVPFSLHESMLAGDPKSTEICAGSRKCDSSDSGVLKDNQWVKSGVDAKHPLQVERHFTVNGSPVPIKQWDAPKSPLYTSETLTAIYGQQFTMGYNK
jgi:RHS repeat-associated protein